MDDGEIESFHIFAAGFDYSNQARPSDFMKVCRQRASQLLQTSKGQAVGFIFFDFRSGLNSLEVYSRKSSGALVHTRSLGSYEAAASKHYRNFYLDGELERTAFNGRFPDVLGIADIYQFLKGFKARFGEMKLSSFNLISHAYYEGPIFLNSYDGLRVSTVGGRRAATWPESLRRSGLRDPHDKDARMNKDFSSSSFSEKEKQDFKSALSDDFYSWIWGCNFSEDAIVIFDKMRKTPNKYQPSGIKDDQQFTFFFSRSSAKEVYENSGTGAFFPASVDERKFIRTMGEIKNYHLDITKATYANELAVFSGNPVYAALPGTWASARTIPMQIRRNGRSLPLIKFYRSYLKATFDRENLGYAKYPLPDL